MHTLRSWVTSLDVSFLHYLVNNLSVIILVRAYRHCEPAHQHLHNDSYFSPCLGAHSPRVSQSSHETMFSLSARPGYAHLLYTGQVFMTMQ